MKPLKASLTNSQIRPLDEIRKMSHKEAYTFVLFMSEVVRQRHMALIYNEMHWKLEHEIRSKAR